METKPVPTFFLAGVMQGARTDGLHDQSYRRRIADTLRRHVPGAEIIDPNDDDCPERSAAPKGSQQRFIDAMQMPLAADAMVAYVPEASMGTAIEMWNCKQSARPVLTISPLKENWAVRFLSDRLFATLEEFEQFAADGGLAELLTQS